jgi:hypothetical protein
MTLVLLAVILGPSIVVFLAGCIVAVTRSSRAQNQEPLRSRQSGRAT